MGEVLMKYNSFEFQLPGDLESTDLVMGILTNDHFDDGEEFSEDLEYSHSLEYTCRERSFNFTALMFFAKFSPDLLRQFLFRKVRCWNNNSLVTVLLYGIDSRYSRVAKPIMRELLKNYRDQILSYIKRQTYLWEEERVMTSPLRVLLSHGCHKTLTFLLRHFNEEELIDALTVRDSLGEFVFNNIASAEDGPSQVKILDILYEFFQPEMHTLVRSAKGLDRDRLFLCLLDAENPEFVSLFIRCFRNESEHYLGSLIQCENIISNDLTEVARMISIELNEIYS